MSRRIRNQCPYCRRVYWQDWEDPDECPYCPNEPVCESCHRPVSECTCEQDATDYETGPTYDLTWYEADEPEDHE